MNYNIEIFKSDSYQKILKAVLKFRYPKSTYEEALKEESKYSTALAYHKNKPLVKCLLEVEYDDTAYVFVGTPITICEVAEMLYNLKKLFISRPVFSLFWRQGCYHIEDEYNGIRLQQNAYYLHEQPQETIDQIAELINL